MKTSTKLLIVFFACVPLSLIAYNQLLKRQYLAGEFVQDIYTPVQQTVNKLLPPFENVVINGQMVIGDTIFTKTPAGNKHTVKSITNWMPKINIEGHNKKQPSLDITFEYEDAVRYQVKNNTLFITFHKSVQGDRDSRYNGGPYPTVVTINSNRIRSVSGSWCNYSIDGPFTKDSLKLTVSDDSYANVNNLDLKYLNVIVTGSAHAEVYDNNKIGELAYSLIDKSNLMIDNSNNTIKRLKAVKLDSLTKITINGNSAAMQKYLK